jgi:hydroxypyruvate isomerase
MKISLCLEMVYPELPWAARIERAAALGAGAVEFWDWRNKPLEEMSAAAEAGGLEIAAFSANRENAPVDARQHTALEREVAAAAEMAVRLRCRSLMLLSDALQADGSSCNAAGGVAPPEKRANLLAALRRLAPLAAGYGLTLLLEPLNTRADHPGYFLESSTAAMEILEEVGHPAVKLLYDVYHMRVMGESVAERLAACGPRLGHVHAAGVPGRGALDPEYAGVAAALRGVGYHGYVGLEFAPAGNHDAAIRAAVELFSKSEERV